MDLLDRLELEHPIVQAGLGGGLATAELAAAVSRAGGLGTVGILPPRLLAAELRRARQLAAGRPIAANLLLPFTRPAHVRACVEARVAAVALFFGFDRRIVSELREAGIVVLHQVGTPEQARRALSDGADALIAQGREAGGHLLATRPTREFLPRALELAGGRPVLAAGGVALPEHVGAVLDAGAAAAVCGSRFLLTEESRAHPAYKRRALGAPRTLETRLFGLGWPDRHRVLPNAATERWVRHERRIAALNERTRRLGRALPLGAITLLPRLQHPRLPLFGPASPLEGMDDRLVEATPLYAGETVRHITRIVPAGEAVRELASAQRAGARPC